MRRMLAVVEMLLGTLSLEAVAAGIERPCTLLLANYPRWIIPRQMAATTTY